MLHFDSDYMQLAHPAILKAMGETATTHYPGYGSDSWCELATERIRQAIGEPEAEVQFLIGGTQTNVVAIDALIDTFEGVLCADKAHINVHESGAVEATGHKVLPLPHVDAKITADSIRDYVDQYYRDENWPHSVAPGMVYITHPTELGAIYTLAELEAISAVCREKGLKLFLDGARLGYGLQAVGTDVTLRDIARLTDAFYIGGTKVGAMLGEALVIPRKGVVRRMLTQVKRHNALLAKRWVIGLQFAVLFEDDLYQRISRNAIDQAMRLRRGLIEKGCRLYCDSPTNQQFLVVTPEQRQRLDKLTTYGFIENLPDGTTVIRLCTAWYTTPEEVDQLLAGM